MRVLTEPPKPTHYVCQACSQFSHLPVIYTARGLFCLRCAIITIIREAKLESN